VFYVPYKMQSGKWRGEVNIGGERRSKTFSKKGDALTWEHEERGKLKAPKPGDVMLFSTLAEKYLEHAAQHTVKTLKEKKALINRLPKEWDSVPVEEVTTAMVYNFLQERWWQSANLFNKDRKNLLSMWNWGQRILDVARNPVAKIAKVAHDVQFGYTPPPEHIMRILAVANREQRVFLDCYLQTAARKSEIFRLRWDDINFERKEIRLGTRKSRDGAMRYDWLPLSDQLTADLYWWYQQRRHPEYVFVSKFGQPLHDRRTFLKTLCKKAEVPAFGFHALRRFVASTLVDKHRVSMKTVQQILRHSNLQTTERYVAGAVSSLQGTVNLLSVEPPPAVGGEAKEGGERG